MLRGDGLWNSPKILVFFRAFTRAVYFNNLKLLGEIPTTLYTRTRTVRARRRAKVVCSVRTLAKKKDTHRGYEILTYCYYYYYNHRVLVAVLAARTRVGMRLSPRRHVWVLYAPAAVTGRISDLWWLATFLRTRLPWDPDDFGGHVLAC